MLISDNVNSSDKNEFNQQRPGRVPAKLTPAQPPLRQKKVKKVASWGQMVLVVIFSGLFFASLSVLTSWAILRGSPRGNATIEQQREIISSEGDVFNKIASEVGESVVSIVADDAAGSGVVIDGSGLILTNKHVVEGLTGSATIIDHTGREYAARVLGRDQSNDIAFLLAEGLGANIPAAKLADSSLVKVGDKVLAIGNALGEFQNTVTSGIVSGIGRPIDVGDADGGIYESLFNLIQTDAAINPGNSGGPLVNLNGEVIGINTAIVRDAQSLGFSIPVNDIKPLIAQVQTTGSLGERAYLGVRYISLNSTTAADLGLSVDEGALIYNSGANPVEVGSPADIAGLQNLDVIVGVNAQKIDDLNSLSSVLSKFKPNEEVALTIFRGGRQIELRATLGTIPN